MSMKPFRKLLWSVASNLRLIFWEISAIVVMWATFLFIQPLLHEKELSSASITWPNEQLLFWVAVGFSALGMLAASMKSWLTSVIVFVVAVGSTRFGIGWLSHNAISLTVLSIVSYAGMRWCGSGVRENLDDEGAPR